MTYNGESVEILSSRENGRVLVLRDRTLTLHPLFMGLGRLWEEGMKFPEELPMEISPVTLIEPDIIDRYPETAKAYARNVKSYWKKATFESHLTEGYNDLTLEEFTRTKKTFMGMTPREVQETLGCRREVWRQHGDQHAEELNFPGDAAVDRIVYNLAKCGDPSPGRTIDEVRSVARFLVAPSIYLQAVTERPLTIEEKASVESFKEKAGKGRKPKYSDAEKKIAREWRTWRRENPKGTMREFIDVKRLNMTPQRLKRIVDSIRH
jgi:hypothetical protein